MVAKITNISIGASIGITNPPPTLVQWANKELKIPNPDFTKKQRMGFWVGNTPRELTLYEWHGETLVLPYGTLKAVLAACPGAQVTTDTYGQVLPTDGRINPVPLYDYQEQAVTEILKAGFGILQSRAGSGKTQMGIAMIQRYAQPALWITHTLDLLKQSKERAELYIDPALCGEIAGGKVKIGERVTFATVQTLSKVDPALLRNKWGVVIVDECHRVCGTPASATMFYKVLNNINARHKYGLSATVHRADGLIKATKALLGEVVYTVPDEQVADRVMRVGIKPCYTGVRLGRECQNTDGTLNYTNLIAYLCEDFDRNHFIGSEIVANAEHPSLILSDRLDHLKALMATLPQSMREKAVMISGKMTSKTGKAEREKAIEDMRQGKKLYLFATYSLAKEGLDIPCLERLYLTTPQKDYAVVTQSIGRIARVSEGKQDPVCYDFIDDAGYLVKAFKKRCSTYRKNGCYFVEETS